MKRLIFLSLIIGVIFSCETPDPNAQFIKENFGMQVTGNSPRGLPYKLHTNLGKTKMDTNSLGFIKFYIFKGDSLVNSWKNAGGVESKFALPVPGSREDEQLSPITEAYKVMGVDDSISIFYPVDSMDRKPPGFENEKYLRYDLVLAKVVDKVAYDEEQKKLQGERIAKAAIVADNVNQTLADLKSGKNAAQVKKTASGLRYIIHEEGQGENIAVGNQAFVHYYGCLMDGKMFDSSFSKPTTFPVAVGQGRVIKGWDEGLQLLKAGSKATFFIPYELAYGVAGRQPTIPEKAELCFYIEVEKVSK